MAYDQIRIVSINRASGVYQVRLNFDNNPLYATTGSHIDINSQGCLMALGTFTSSHLTGELSNFLGTLNIELSDSPDTTGNVIRDSFDQARIDGYNVHCVVARYSNANPPVFEEYVFAGTLDPREITIGHRFITSTTRRTETISCSFTPAKRLELPLSEIDWQETDMASEVRPNWLCVVDEPDLDGELNRTRMLSARMSGVIVNGETLGSGSLGTSPKAPHATTKNLAYGGHRKSAVGDIIWDTAGITPFPTGNWNIHITTVINKLCDACNVQWDGVYPTNLFMRKAEYSDGANVNIDTGDLSFDYLCVNWNYAFGINPFETGLNYFKGPATWDSDMLVSDVLKGLAAQAKCRLDINEYDSEGRPILRFIAFGQTAGTFPDLERLPDSSEDAFITDKDGVRVTRRGYDGAVIAPANARSPIDIEIPLGPYAIAYETAPPFDASRCTPNASLTFKEQWKCGHRGALSTEDTSGEEVTPLNPEGWVVGSHLFYYDSRSTLKHFPYKHGNNADGSVLGYDHDIEDEYRAGGWSGYYPVHAIYDVDPDELTDEQKKARQQNFLISYALTFGRYLRGERRRLSTQFHGVVAPNWSSIATGQTFDFTPVADVVTYLAAEIERDIFNDILSVRFEEESPTTLPMSYRIDGDQKGSGSIGGQGQSGDDTGTPPLTNGATRNVKFYSAGVVVKEITMYVEEFYDAVNERKVAQNGVPNPYDEVTGNDYGNNSEFYFHYKGAEFGNVEVVGVSPEDMPDYWASGITQLKQGTPNTDINYSLQNFMWSEDVGDFLYQRPLERAHVNRRIKVAGRFVCEKNVPGNFFNFVWQQLAVNPHEFSDEDCLTDIDVGATGATSALPTLVGNNNSVDIIWGARYKPVTIQGQMWGSNSVVNAVDFQTGANPVRNQICVSTPASNMNSVNMTLWLNDHAGILGAVHTTLATATDIDAIPLLDVFTWEFWGELEIIGDDATTF